ncbi:hypothetical protein U9M48_033075 [Paspalum notatum var. saurae]|uniref:Uncharacterized protein n=1 Tax=Paspalum notatum var. saurae TaxID=547442 RepID=A0AAQ3U626_PASNO
MANQPGPEVSGPGEAWAGALIPLAFGTLAADQSVLARTAVQNGSEQEQQTCRGGVHHAPAAPLARVPPLWLPPARLAVIPAAPCLQRAAPPAREPRRLPYSHAPLCLPLIRAPSPPPVPWPTLERRPRSARPKSPTHALICLSLARHGQIGAPALLAPRNRRRSLLRPETDREHAPLRWRLRSLSHRKGLPAPERLGVGVSASESQHCCSQVSKELDLLLDLRYSSHLRGTEFKSGGNAYFVGSVAGTSQGGL